MKIVILSQYYDPEPVPIPGQIARHLHDAGHDVQVLTGLPNYPEGRLYEGFDPSGGVDAVDGIPVHRVKSFLSHSSSAAGRLASYGGFAGAAARQGVRVLAQADVVYVYATQMTASVPALFARLRAGRTPFVLHVQDLWPESVTDSSMLPRCLAGPARAVMTPWLAWTYRNAAAVVGIAPTMVETLRGRVGSRTPVHMIYNWSGARRAEAAVRERPGEQGALRLMYAGNLGDLQDLENVVEAVERAAQHRPVHWRVAGGGSAEKRIRAAAADLIDSGTVTFLGRLPQDELAEHEAWADAHVIPLKDLKVFHGTIPSKLQNALAGGIPVITSVAGDVAGIVADNALGFAARPEDPAALAEAFLALADLDDAAYRAMSARCIEFYRQSMSADAALTRIEEILVDAAQTSQTDSDRSAS
ncbi:glycosyltransferase family 4 protein [Micrococcus luteus]|uniref:glycosyltransferase family 4 protein n=1 Tax=Micrococcus luteus TaxID=1270 RepID=UPI00382AFB76